MIKYTQSEAFEAFKYFKSIGEWAKYKKRYGLFTKDGTRRWGFPPPDNFQYYCFENLDFINEYKSIIRDSKLNQILSK